jgi:hypothetical protein
MIDLIAAGQIFLVKQYISVLMWRGRPGGHLMQRHFTRVQPTRGSHNLLRICWALFGAAIPLSHPEQHRQAGHIRDGRGEWGRRSSRREVGERLPWRFGDTSNWRGECGEIESERSEREIELPELRERSFSTNGPGRWTYHGSLNIQFGENSKTIWF